MSSCSSKNNPFNSVDVNDYVICQIKRKLSPFFMRPQKKLRQEYQLLLTKANEKNRNKQINPNYRNSQTSTPQSSMVTFRSKMKSHFQTPNPTSNLNLDPNADTDNSNQFLKQQSSDKKYQPLKNKVFQYLKCQKQKQNIVDFSSSPSPSQPSTNSHRYCNSLTHRKHHRRIVTSLNKPFQFGKIVEEMKKNERQKQRDRERQCNYIQNQQMEKMNILKNCLTERSIQKNGALGNPKRKANDIKNILGINLQLFKNRKKSLKIQQIDLNLKQDKIDLQFQEGLVEEIYQAKRVKFRQKINNIKSRKNIYDGQLYFLKD